MKRLIIFLTVIVMCSCNRADSSSTDCFGASSPVDLTMINDCTSDKIVKLYQQISPGNFELLKSTKVERTESKTICIENEGPIEDGLYLKIDNLTKVIKLQYGIEFKLNSLRLNMHS